MEVVLFRPGPEDEVLVPSLPDFGLGQTVALADPPPPLWLVVAHGVCLGPVLVLGMDVADGIVVPAVTAGVKSPLDNVTPVGGGVAHTQLTSFICFKKYFLKYLEKSFLTGTVLAAWLL